MNLGNPFDTPGLALIDGFTCSGSKAGGGIYAGGTLALSNVRVTGNTTGPGATVGFFSGGGEVVERDGSVHRLGGNSQPEPCKNVTPRLSRNVTAVQQSRAWGGETLRQTSWKPCLPVPGHAVVMKLTRR